MAQGRKVAPAREHRSEDGDEGERNEDQQSSHAHLAPSVLPPEAPERVLPPLPRDGARTLQRGHVGHHSGRVIGRLHQSALTRGSRYEYRRSATRFATMTATLKTRKSPSSKAKSWLPMASYVSRPRPGHEKIVSMTMAPPRT